MKNVLIAIGSLLLISASSIKTGDYGYYDYLGRIGGFGDGGGGGGNIDYGKYTVPALVGAAIAIPTAAILASWISTYATYNSINNELDYLEIKGRWAPFKHLYWKKNYLINNTITEDNFDTVLRETETESVDFPLIAIFKKLQQYDALFMKMREISDKLIFNARKNSSFYQKLLAQRERLETVIKRVQHNLSMVKKHPHWNEQWKLYQRRDIALEKTNVWIKGIKDIVHPK